ncbi:SDR family oxidoreductase [Gordonia desulfuricans]|uniref:SDR family oxidoreductase n=1 Tax=Gordonia desulfuricans TaxID=89051 RepID=A0A7K3LQ88_9ACTN|nr:SDR family oxidoreductase [Gordonia desulfuricans]NDK90231.1 SDR family oxidoreductase [Gordonia desulfuricans]
MRVTVFGASGEIGRRLVGELEARGVDVVAAQRSTGVDAYAGTGLDGACTGTDVVVDAINVTTLKAKVAVDFFSTSAANIAAAAQRAGARRVVCLSIINAADEQVNAKFGYYQGKAAQERVYTDALGPGMLRIVRSAQWFELAEQLLSRARFGPVAAVAHMRCRPLAAADAARVLADAVTDSAGGDVEVAGPAEMDLADIAKHLARKQGSPRWVFAVNVGGPAMRDGGLVPRGEFTQTSTTLEQWLAAR